MTSRSPRRSYPWAELYNLESNLGRSPQVVKARRPGRPNSPIPRKKKTLAFTEEEETTLKRLTYKIGGFLNPGSVNRGQVVGLALRLLEMDLERINLPGQETVDWPALVEALVAGKAR